MTDPTEEAQKATEVLDAAGDLTPADEQDDALGDDGAAAETASETTTTDDGPSGLDRLFRTDRSLDLDDTTDFWDPRGKGGINRIGAALKQAGGLKALPPAVWLPIGVFEALYVFLEDRDLIPGRSGQQ